MWTHALHLWGVLVLSMPHSQADSFASWLNREIQEYQAEIALPLDRLEMLMDSVNAAVGGYELERIDPCRLAAISNQLIPQTVQHAAMQSAVPDYVRFTFLRQLLTDLHAPAFDAAEPIKIESQINQLAYALRESIGELMPDLGDHELLDALEREWAEAMHELMQRCTNGLFKVPLPTEVFDELFLAVRNAPIAEYPEAVEILRDRLPSNHTNAEKSRRAIEIEVMSRRMGHSAETRERLLSVGRRPLSPTMLHFQLSTIGEAVMNRLIYPAWREQFMLVVQPDTHASPQPVSSEWERVGVGVEEEERIHGLLVGNHQ
jgi:hypothetical protein